MPSYSNYGPRDSQVVEVGDVGFNKLNQRLRPDQLAPGEIAVSENGRMDVDGSWQPRKGLEAIGGTLTANTRVITLGTGTWKLFGGSVSDVGAFLSFDGVDASVDITITTPSRFYLASGQSVTLSGFTQVGPSAGTYPWDINGTYIGHTGMSGTSLVLSTTTPYPGAPAETEFEWAGGTLTVPTSFSISSATRSTTTITVTTSVAHGLSSNTIVEIAGLTGTVDPNGNRLITVTGSTTFTFTIAGATGSETYGGTGVVNNAELSASQTNGVYGQCRFSDPADDNAEYIIRATNLNAIATSVATGVSTTIAYPTDLTITGRCELLQAFDRVFLFREGLTALEWDGDLSGTPAFTLVANGTYTQPVYLNSSSNTTIADGVATVTEASHGLSVGDRVFVIDKGSTELVKGGDGYTVATVPTSGSFTVNAQVADITSHSVVWSKRISSGEGFMHMPAPAWGVYHQRRLWVPYSYVSSGSSGTPTITDRNIRDEIVASDILDSDTYDRIANQFRVTAGIADFLVGALPFAEDNLLIFNRNSIHIATGISGSLTDVALRLVTSELGCVARNTIVQVGNEVFFLSDNGVYSVNFGDLYNLRGAGLPLSAAIQPIIARINTTRSQFAVATYFSNRYYIAVPLDGSNTNNAILIYNFLNGGWESVDEISSVGLDVQGFIPASSGGLNRLFIVSASGAIHEIDSREDGRDRLSLFAGIDAALYDVNSTFTTRQYTNGMLDRKTFSGYDLHVQSSDSGASDAVISGEVENPDWSGTLTTIRGLLGDNLAVGEDAALRGRIGNKRGYGFQLTVAPSTGRPKVRAVKVTATVTNLAQSQSS